MIAGSKNIKIKDHKSMKHFLWNKEKRDSFFLNYSQSHAEIFRLSFKILIIYKYLIAFIVFLSSNSKSY